MSDECKNCVASGKMELCMEVPCDIHHYWYCRQMKEKVDRFEFEAECYAEKLGDSRAEIARLKEGVEKWKKEFEEGHRAWAESDEHKNADELREENAALKDALKDCERMRENFERWNVEADQANVNYELEIIDLKEKVEKMKVMILLN